MNEMFVAGMVVGWVLGVITVFVALVTLAWRDEMLLVRSIKGESDDDDE